MLEMDVYVSVLYYSIHFSFCLEGLQDFGIDFGPVSWYSGCIVGPDMIPSTVFAT